MTSSDILIEKIKEFEGCRLTAYKDSKGIYTIGVGHTQGVKAGQTITQAEADAYLRQDLQTAERQVASLGLTLTQAEYDAVVDFTFNCGIGNLRRSTLLKYIRHKSTDLLIAREFMRWTRSGGKVLKGLIRRRKWEAERFTGKEIYQDADTLKWFLKK